MWDGFIYWAVLHRSMTTAGDVGWAILKEGEFGEPNERDMSRRLSPEEYDSMFADPRGNMPPETSQSGNYTAMEEHIANMLLGSLSAYLESEDGDFIRQDIQDLGLMGGRMPIEQEMMAGRQLAYNKLEAWLNSIGA